jgi:ATP-dependent 26S proteasome regulatory subunit
MLICFECSMKLDKAPTESYADIGGLEQQIQEIKVRI